MSDSQKRSKKKPVSPKQAVLRVIRRLRAAGYEALLAGGCVRDILLGKVPHDYDVATNAAPQTVSGLFPRTFTVGARFGVVVVLIGPRQIEVATFRSDDQYLDGRRPRAVVFTDARHDAQRRDFTINGMFLDPLTNKVIDYVGGRADLQKHLIRAIGNPAQRFAEDHLRMLRALRFASRFVFRIAPATWNAIRQYAPKITRVSAERITVELEYILTDPRRARGVELARDSGLLRWMLPSVTDQETATGLKVLARLPARCSFALALAALLVEVDPDRVRQLCRSLKTSNELGRQVHWLVAQRPLLLEAIPLSRGPLKKWLAQPLFEPLVQLNRYYLQALKRSMAPLVRLRRQIADLGDEPISPPRLLDGHQLIELGAPPGPMVGRLAEELYLAQLENHVRTCAQARDWVKNWLVRHNLTPRD